MHSEVAAFADFTGIVKYIHLFFGTKTWETPGPKAFLIFRHILEYFFSPKQKLRSIHERIINKRFEYKVKNTIFRGFGFLTGLWDL